MEKRMWKVDIIYTFFDEKAGRVIYSGCNMRYEYGTRYLTLALQDLFEHTDLTPASDFTNVIVLCTQRTAEYDDGTRPPTINGEWNSFTMYPDNIEYELTKMAKEKD